MTSASFPIDELLALADAACDASLSDADAARLEELLRGNPEAQRLYLVPVAESLLAGDNAANNVGIERQGLFVRVSESFFSVYGRPVTLFLQIKT